MPNDPEFQKRVLCQALNLLESSGPAILAEFPEDAPHQSGDAEDVNEGWICPVSLSSQSRDSEEETVTESLEREISELLPWYDLALQKLERTTVGASGLNIHEAAKLLVSFVEDEIVLSPLEGESIDRVLKWVCDDLKAFYFEAVLAQPGSPSSGDLNAWFFGQTTLGSVFFMVQKTLLQHTDQALNLVGKQFLIPRSQQHLALSD